MNAIEVPAARYAWGQSVIALYDLANDGTYPKRGEDEVLVARGSLGERRVHQHGPVNQRNAFGISTAHVIRHDPSKELFASGPF